jgi:hypothetical protein
VCSEYAGAKHPTFCKACGDWTDNIEIAKMEAAEKPAAVVVAPVPEPETPRKPMANAHVAEPFRSILNNHAYGIASIGNGLYCRTAPPKKNKRNRFSAGCR